MSFRPTDQKFSPRLNAFLPWFVGTVIFLALIAVVEIFTGWANVLALWGHLSSITLATAFALFAISHLIRAMRIYAYVTRVTGDPFRTTLKLSLIHQFTNNMLPMRLGEAAYPILMKRYFGAHWSASLASLFWLRLLDGVIVIGLLLLVYVWKFQELLWLALMGVLVSLTMYLWLKKVRPEIMPKWFLQVIDTLHEAAPKSLSDVAILMGLTLACWVSKLYALALFITSLKSMSLSAALSGVLGAELSSILPIHGIAGSGTYEVAFMAAALPHGITDESVIANAISVHLFVITSTSILALLVVPLKVRNYKQSTAT